jgi:DNA repair protein RAD51/nuclear pore complex protein Nup160
MAGTRGTSLYKEARLNLEPAFPGSTISITLPARDTSTFGARTHPKRSVVTEYYTDRDEDAFSRRHLASDGSMYFRKHHQYPRSFLWRLLDNRKALEIQSTDLEQGYSDPLEANITIVLRFASPIRPFCLTFAEPQDRDALTVFAVTSANEFYEISLPRDFFLKPAASELEINDWCKRPTLTQLTIRTPFRLVALSNNRVLATLDNGSILCLTKSSEDELIWDESLYSETSWTGSMRDLIPWKREQKVRFDNGELDLSAAANVALSPDSKHIISVCLNHKLRAWNLLSGKPGFQIDLLGETEKPNDKGTSYVIGPSHSTLMAIINIPGGADGVLYHVITYSPKQHQFKFWGVRDGDDPEQGIFDTRPDFDFVPPIDELMDTTAWTLAEFFIKPGPVGWRETELWIRARSGPSSKVYSLKFDLHGDPQTLAFTWKNNWATVDPGSLSLEQLKQNPSNPAEHDFDPSELFEIDLSEKWLDFLFFPGRFTIATLEAALLVFRRGLERAKATQSTNKGSLKERICAAVTAFAGLEQESVVSQIAYQESVATQWQAYYSLVKDLHKRRGEHLSLAFDHESGRPWLILSDYLSAIRLCSDPATVALRSHSPDIAKLLNAASSFRKSFPRGFHARLQREIEGELLQSRSLSILDRMELMEANCNLSQQVSDDDLSILVEDLGTEVRHLTSEMFLRAMESLGVEDLGRPSGENRKKKQISRYGLDALVRVSQDALETSRNVLLDLLVLVLFMQYEEDLSEDFDAAEIYVEIINELQDNAVLTWLATTVWSHPTSTGPSSENLIKSLSETYKSRKKLPITQTVLAGILGFRSHEVTLPAVSATELLTYWGRAWLDLVFKNTTFAAALQDTMGILLLQEEYGLALEFSKYLPESNWATYQKARVHLALGDFSLASIYFQKPAYNLGKWAGMKNLKDRSLTSTALGSFNIEDTDSVNFTPAEQRDSFSNGLARYYSHVLSHFERYEAYPYVADFAHLGLRCLKGDEEKELRTDLLSRLFNASIKTSRFDDAYTAMIRHTDTAL